MASHTEYSEQLSQYEAAGGEASMSASAQEFQVEEAKHQEILEVGDHSDNAEQMIAFNSVSRPVRTNTA